MNILWFTWKDVSHPEAGGAEVVNHEIAKRAVAQGHSVVFLVGGYKGAKREEINDGYKIIRLGNRWSVYPLAFWEYWKRWRGWADLCIEEVNTIPFMTPWYVQEKRVLIFYQLCREIWFYQMVFPLNIIGYLLEPLYVWFLSQQRVITISQSSKKDLERFGFRSENISIIPLGLTIDPIKSLKMVKKPKHFTILSFGSLRAMKQTMDHLRAFEQVKQKIPDARLVMVGKADSAYGKKVLKALHDSPYSKDIEYRPFCSQEEKTKYMQQAHVILMTSVKEGWGLVVSEAASQGTPAVVYDRDGLRDSNYRGEAGKVVPASVEAMAAAVLSLASQPDLYKKLQYAGWKKACAMNFAETYTESLKIFESVVSGTAPRK